MQIFMDGHASRGFAPDKIVASVNFKFHADTYDQALKGGVEIVKKYFDDIANATDFSNEDFKTKAYAIREIVHYNRIEPKSVKDLSKNLEQRVSGGFDFSQYAYLEFDYNKSRLAALLVATSKIVNAPLINIDFTLADVESKKRELIADAYNDAKLKAEALAGAACKDLRDCVRVEIDPPMHDRFDGGFGMAKMANFERAATHTDEFQEQIKMIDDTFKPNDIDVYQSIKCVWETSN